jgi:hypothetical protein
MKIAVFSDTYDQINGVAITYKHFAEYAEKNNYKIDIFTQGEKEDLVEKHGSVRIFRFSPTFGVKFYSELYFDLWLPNRRILQKVKREKYNMILSAALGSMGVNALIIAKKPGIPLVGEYNTDIPKYIRPGVEKYFKSCPKIIQTLIIKPLEILSLRYIKWYFRSCNLALTISDYNVKQLRDLIKKDVGLFSRGVDLEMFSPEKKRKHGENHIKRYWHCMLEEFQ